MASYPFQSLDLSDPMCKYPTKVTNIMFKGAGDFLPALNYNLISRLAIYILSNNALIKRALQGTYSHVFLDEFQDTTDLQYKFINICFKNTNTILTAVGDQKQRIMVWAGAMPNAFEMFNNDFKAKEETLLMNHRSAQHLISLQKTLYASLKEKEIDILSGAKCTEIFGDSAVYIFEKEEIEKKFIVNKITEFLKNGVKPRDICVLVKHSINNYLHGLLGTEIFEGVKIRNEVTYQDLLKEDVVKLILGFFHCATSNENADAYSYLVNILMQIRCIDVEDIEKVNLQLIVLGDILKQFTIKLDEITPTDNENKIFIVSKMLFDFLGEKSYKDFYPQYENGDFFEITLKQTLSLIWQEYIVSRDWRKALKSFEGEMSIPAMTIHKSKGLEFDSVFLVGMEDYTFFSSRGQLNEEDLSAFFVAVSRAKRNLYICSSKIRTELGRNSGAQGYNLINNLIDTIKEQIKIEYIQITQDNEQV